MRARLVSTALLLGLGLRLGLRLRAGNRRKAIPRLTSMPLEMLESAVLYLDAKSKSTFIQASKKCKTAVTEAQQDYRSLLYQSDAITITPPYVQLTRNACCSTKSYIKKASQSAIIFNHPYNPHTTNYIGASQNNSHMKRVVLIGPYNEFTIDAVRALQHNPHVKRVEFIGPYNEFTIDALRALKHNPHVRCVFFHGTYDSFIAQGISILSQDNPHVHTIYFWPPKMNKPLITYISNRQ